MLSENTQPIRPSQRQRLVIVLCISAAITLQNKRISSFLHYACSMSIPPWPLHLSLFAAISHFAEPGHAAAPNHGPGTGVVWTQNEPEWDWAAIDSSGASSLPNHNELLPVAIVSLDIRKQIRPVIAFQGPPAMKGTGMKLERLAGWRRHSGSRDVVFV
jgi:hypothetical protein